MGTKISLLKTPDELDEAWSASSRRPLFLMKHSLICGTSHGALEAFRSFAESADSDLSFALLEIQPHRDLSREVAQRSGVRHQSPQVLLLVDGVVVWSKTHWSITEKALSAAVAEALATSPR